MVLLLSTPDVSVVVIVYNDAARLPRAVASALEQSLHGVEVITVDDASTDATPRASGQLAADHADRVRMVRLTTNSGGADGRGTPASRSHGAGMSCRMNATRSAGVIESSTTRKAMLTDSSRVTRSAGSTVAPPGR
jgi:cellulose synthase/poly-beta-1,6-N-acetylglucosamine synthase-like glycosyltransferase